jgi:hypothetical protein
MCSMATLSGKFVIKKNIMSNLTDGRGPLLYDNEVNKPILNRT